MRVTYAQRLDARFSGARVLAVVCITQSEHHMVTSDVKNFEVSGNELQERASVVYETWLSAAAFSQQLRVCSGCLSLSYSS